jgi:RNA polymerase sigma-70 factor (ECF subfamily)
VDLTSRLAAGVDQAFPDLVRSMQDQLFSGVLRITACRADAQDITQETFVRAYRALRGYPPDRVRSLKLSGWLWTIALNLCRNRARSLARHPVAADNGRLAAHADRGPGPEELAVGREPPLADQLATLPEAMRVAVVLRHVVGLPYAELAEVLDRPEGTVKADVHRGLERLRKLLQEPTTPGIPPLSEVTP